MVEDSADGRRAEGSVWSPFSAAKSLHVRPLSLGPFLVFFFPIWHCAHSVEIHSADDLWQFFEGWPLLALPLSSLHSAKTLAARRRILDGIKKWHAFAKQHKDYEKEDPDYE